MVDSFEADNDEFRVIKGDKIAFDTGAPSFSLFNTGRLQFNTTVVYPDMLSSLFYFSNAPGSTSYCESWSSLYPQEWGPDEPNVSPGVSSVASIQRNLPRTYIGSVPSGTNHLNIMARVTRTKAPPAFYQDIPPAVFNPPGQWVTLTGGSCTVEGIGTAMKRHFDIVLYGTDLYLERYQSVYNVGFPFVSSSNANNRGWLTNLTNDGAAMGAYNSAPVGLGVPLVLLERKGPDSSGTKFAPWGSNSSNPCSVGANLDYESIYSVDFDIRPGRYL